MYSYLPMKNCVMDERSHIIRKRIFTMIRIYCVLYEYIWILIIIKSLREEINKLKNNSSILIPYLLLFIQPVFMASNLIVARGGVEFVPPISLAFWRWTIVFIILFLFNYEKLIKKKKNC